MRLNLLQQLSAPTLVFSEQIRRIAFTRANASERSAPFFADANANFPSKSNEDCRPTAKAKLEYNALQFRREIKPCH